MMRTKTHRILDDSETLERKIKRLLRTQYNLSGSFGKSQLKGYSVIDQKNFTYNSTRINHQP